MFWRFFVCNLKNYIQPRQSVLIDKFSEVQLKLTSRAINQKQMLKKYISTKKVGGGGAKFQFYPSLEQKTVVLKN